MSNYQADAFVVVRANTKPFRDELLKSINQFEKKAVRIKILPDMRGFQKALRAELTSITSKVTGQVRITPDMRGFKTAVQTAVRDATKGIPATAGPARGVATTRAAARPRGPQPILSASGKPLFGAAAEVRKEAQARLAEEQKIQSAVRAAEIKAHAENVKRDKARAALDAQARIAAIEAAQKAGLVSKTGQPLAGAAAEAKAAALERQKAELAATEKIQAAETAAHVKNTALDKKRAADDLKARQATLAALGAQGLLSASGKPLTGAARDAKIEANERVAAAAAAQKEIDRIHATAIGEDRRRTAAAIRAEINARIAGENQVATARARSQALATEAVQTRRAVGRVADFVPAAGTSAVTAARKQLDLANEALTRSEQLFTATIGTNERALQKHVATTLRDARAVVVLQEAVLKDTIETERNTAAKAKNRSFGARGFGAQLAQFAGLRGAVLAANATFIAGTVAAIAFGKAVASAVSFESDLNVFRVTVGATGEEMEQVSETAKQLGRDITLPGVAASDAAQAMQLLARAGLNVDDAVTASRGALQLATAAQIDNAEAVKLTASALNAFGLAGSEATHVADVLTNAANASQGEISDMGIALQQASAVARQAGISLEDTTSLLSLLAKNGIAGSDAGTSLRVALTRLQAPTKKAQAELNRLGVTIRDSVGNVRPEAFSEIVKALDETGGATAKARSLFVIFGQDAQRAASIFGREGIPGLNQMREQMNQVGSASELASARMTGLRGSAENLKNQLSALGLTIGQVAIPPLKALTDGFALFFSTVNESIDNIGKFTGAVFGAAKGFQILADAIKGDDLKVDAAGTGDVVSELQKLQNERDNFAEGGFVPKFFAGETKELTDRLTELGKAAQATGNSNALAGFLNSFVRNSPAIAKAFKDGIITPAENAELAATALGRTFLKFVPKDAFTGLGAAARSGIEDASRQAGQGVDNMGAHIHSRIEEMSRGANLRAGAAGKGVGDAFAAGLSASIGTVDAALAGLSREALDIEIAGGPNEQRKLLANLEEAETKARAKVATREKQRAAGSISNEPVTAAKNQLKTILDQQETIRNQMKADADQATAKAESDARDIQEKLNKADQATLDALAPATRKLDTRALIAQGTTTVQDNIAVARAQQANNLKQIAVIQKSFNDKKKAAELVSDLRDQNIVLNQQIASDIQGLIDDGSTAFQLRFSAAQAAGNVNKQIALIDERTADLKKMLAAGTRQKGALEGVAKNSKEVKAAAKLTGDARIAAQTEINNLFNQKLELQRQPVDERIALGQSIFDLTGNKNPLLRAIDLAVATTNKQIDAAKKAGKSTVVLRTVLNGYLNQRKNVLEDAAKDAKAAGTTAFDLLSQFTSTFNETAGNLVGPDQPFISPNAFTKGIQPFLDPQAHRSQRDLLRYRGRPDSTDRAIDRLIDALNQNTQATQGNSAAQGSTAFSMPNYVNVTGQRAQAMAKFWEARGARDATQG